MTTYPTAAQERLHLSEIIAKHDSGQPLSPWESSVYRLNVRPNGTRYSQDKDTRDAELDADIQAEQRRRKA